MITVVATKVTTNPFAGECGGKVGHDFVWQEHMETPTFNLDATNNQNWLQENVEAEHSTILCDK